MQSAINPAFSLDDYRWFFDLWCPEHLGRDTASSGTHARRNSIVTRNIPQHRQPESLMIHFVLDAADRGFIIGGTERH